MARRMDRGASVGGTKKTKLSTKQNNKKKTVTWTTNCSRNKNSHTLSRSWWGSFSTSPPPSPSDRSFLQNIGRTEKQKKKSDAKQNVLPVNELACARGILFVYFLFAGTSAFSAPLLLARLAIFVCVFVRDFFFFSFLSSGRQSEWSTALKLLVLFFQTWRPSGIFAYTCTCFESCCSWQLDALGYCFMLVV